MRTLLVIGLGFLAATAAATPVDSTGLRPDAQQPAPADAPTSLPIARHRTLAPPPAGPPALPPAAESVAPLTIETLVRRQNGRRNETIRQTVSRTVDRIHTAASDGSEWLFERNPRDRSRVSGTRIDHASRALIHYEESDLRNMMGLRGWAQVLSLGLDHERLHQLRATSGSRTIAGLRVTRFAAEQEDVELREVWWSEAEFLPAGFTSTQGATSLRFSVERVRPGVDTALLRPAATRFPTYRVVDLAEWLERQ